MKLFPEKVISLFEMIPATTAKPFRVWLGVAFFLLPFIALLDVSLIMPFLFQMCLFYFFLARFVLSLLGYVKPLFIGRKKYESIYED